MSFWDDFLPIVGTVAGGIGGSFMGPAGAIAGAGLGGKAGSGLAGIFGGSDEGAGMSQAQIDLYKKLLGELPTYQGPQPGQGLTAVERAGFRQAQMGAEGVAQGREGAIEQDVRRRQGGVASAGGLAAARMIGNQGAMNRLSQGDLSIAGESVNRDIQSERALNDFNQRNMANKMQIAGGLGGAYQNEMNRQQYSSAAQQGKYANLFQGIGDFGTGMMNRDLLEKYMNRKPGNTPDLKMTGGYDPTDLGPMPRGYGDYNPYGGGYA